MEWVNLWFACKFIVLVIAIIFSIICAIPVLLVSFKQQQNAKKVEWLYQNGFIMANKIWVNRETKENLTCDEVCKMSYKKLINSQNR